MAITNTIPLACLAFVTLAITPPARAQSEGKATDPEVLALASLPYSFVQRFIKSELSIDYVVGSKAVNPFYLTGDFDGDGQMDYVLRLVSKKDKDKEEDAVFFATGAPRLLSKDIEEEYPGPAWYIVSKKERPGLKGDAIMMLRPESSTALVSWDGKRFKLSWEGD